MAIKSFLNKQTRVLNILYSCPGFYLSPLQMLHILDDYLVGIMVLNSTFNNISVISWWSVIGEGNRRKPQTRHKSLKTLSHTVILSTPRLSGVRTHNFSGDRH
jgi:hypothetical protein